MANDIENLVKTPMHHHSENSSPQTSPKMILEPKILDQSSKKLIKLHPALTATNYDSWMQVRH